MEAKTTFEITFSVVKGYFGWKANTFFKHNGYDWELHTGKTNSGKLVSSLQAGVLKQDSNGTIFIYTPYTDPSYLISKFANRCTHKNIHSQHSAALLIVESYVNTPGKLPSRDSIINPENDTQSDQNPS